MKTGYIVAVCTSIKAGIPKYPRDQVVIAEHGVEHDYHNKAVRRSFKFPFRNKPNIDRHITIVGKEAIDVVNQNLNLHLDSGSLGENILTFGLGDLSDIPDGAMIYSGNVALRVVEQNQPCRNLVPIHRRLNKEIYGRRGLLCAVVAGIGSVIKPNDLITIQW